MVGEDFLGLRGIASELGISSLSVPKKLLRPKGGRMGPGSSLPYVEPLLAFYFVVPHPHRLWFFLQKQTVGASSTLPAAAVIRTTRIDTDGRRNYRALTTVLQVSVRGPCTTSNYSPKAPTHRRRWNRRDRIDNANHPRAVSTATPPLSNNTTADCATTSTTSTTSSTHPPRRRAKPRSNKDGSAWADRWWEVDKLRGEEEAEEGERPRITWNWWWRWRRPWCREWVGRRRNERSYKHERRDWWRRSADDRGRISTRKCWRDHRRDAGLNHDSDWNTRADWYHRRGTDCDEEERWTREGKEG